MDGTEDYAAQLKRFAAAFIASASGSLVVELRVPDVPQRYGRSRTEAGFFDLLSDEGKRGFWSAVLDYAQRPVELQPAGVYVTMNPVDPIFLARANNRMAPPNSRKISAEDKDVLARRWLVVDADPTRPISGISATDAEKAAAKLLVDGVREDLRGRGWSEPILCDSGNGYHLWYRIDEPAGNEEFVQHALHWLASRHDSAGATVDTSVFNASRIMKVPGTWARKGSPTADRPHRVCRVLEVPTEGEHVQGHAA